LRADETISIYHTTTGKHISDVDIQAALPFLNDARQEVEGILKPAKKEFISSQVVAVFDALGKMQDMPKGEGLLLFLSAIVDMKFTETALRYASKEILKNPFVKQPKAADWIARAADFNASDRANLILINKVQDEAKKQGLFELKIVHETEFEKLSKN